jgi:hypothetical protein
MMVQLRRSPEREQALQQFISAIHDPTSPLFHQWITAEEFGQRFGVPEAEVAKVTDWLESQGFTVNLVYPNQMVIDFTGTAGQIRQAFHTEIHNLMVKGQAHIANMSDPQIPAELAATVAGVVSLNDFRLRPMFRPHANSRAGSRPDYTFTFPCGRTNPCTDFAVVPADLWTIYNFTPTFTAGFSGQGQTIVVLEDSDLYTTTDWNTFRSTLGLSGYSGTLTTVHPNSGNNCADPGVNPNGNGDDAEAAVDVEWASAAAPSAAIVLASCLDTTTNTGQFIALQNLLASGTPPAIISLSYGASESDLGAASNAYINSLYQQAVTAGVSVFVSAGDEGAASSDADQGDTEYTEYGITISGLASTPYNVAVGGTDFADIYENPNSILNGSSTYWSTTNASNYGSAKSYIPETPWNDSCASVLIADYIGVLPAYNLCNTSPYNQPYSQSDPNGLLTTGAGGGGPSACATGAPDIQGLVGGTCAGYAKPSWQSGFISNPNDGVRDIPDVSIFASDGSFWGHYYVICFTDQTNGGTPSCTQTISENGTPVNFAIPDNWAGGGGTSFAAPVWAGIQALINQASGSRWGNPNPSYYALAATEYGSGGSPTCNSAALLTNLATNCIFYDVTTIPLLYAGKGSTGGDTDLPCYGMNCYDPLGTSAYGVLSTVSQSLTLAYVTSLGSGYTSAPACTLSGGGGSGAACSGSFNGVVTSLNLTNGGSGYTSVPSCTISAPPTGTTATCVADIYVVGPIVGVTLTNFGSGYTSTPACTISGGGGSGATCTATEGLGIGVTLTAAGSGYTTLPHCFLSGGGATTAGTCAALAVNTSGGYIPSFVASTGWDFATGIGTVNVSNLISKSIPVTVSPLSLTFGNQTQGTTSSADTVTVTNNGSESLIFTSIGVTGDFATASGTTCNTSTPVAANGGSCVINVTFTPTVTGSRSGSLTLTDNASTSPQTVSLSGTGTTAASLSTTNVTFPNQPVGMISAASPVTVTNNGPGSLTFTGIAVTAGTANFAIATSGTTCSTSTPVANGSNCAINVTFTPTAPGALTGTLTITGNFTTSPQAVSLSGTGTAPSVGLNPTSVTFNSQPVSTTSAASTVTVTNNGTASLTFSNVAIGGTNPSDFAVAGSTTCSTSTPVAASGGNCVINVTFTPTATGTRSASLTLTDNASPSTQTVTLSGTGTTPSVGLSPTSVTFANQLVGTTSAASTVTVTNNAVTSLAFTNIAATGDFAVASGTTCSTNTPVALGSTCVINVTFTPSAPGSRSGNLTLADNATGSPQTVGLSGTGTAPVVGLSATSLSFGNQPTSTTSAAQTVTVTNTGTANLSISKAAIGGTNSGDFAKSADTCSGATLTTSGASSTCTVSVTFTPSAAGSRSASLIFTDNNNDVSGSTQTVTLSGTGTGLALSLSPSSLTFPAEIVGTSSSAQTVTLTNTGTASLTISSIGAGGDFSQTNTCGTTVSVSANCTISVTFKPTAAGTWTGTLSISDNAPGSPQTVALSGTGLVFTVGPHPPTVPRRLPSFPVPGQPTAPVLPIRPASLPVPGRPSMPPIVPLPVPPPGTGTEPVVRSPGPIVLPLEAPSLPAPEQPAPPPPVPPTRNLGETGKEQVVTWLGLAVLPLWPPAHQLLLKPLPLL